MCLEMSLCTLNQIKPGAGSKLVITVSIFLPTFQGLKFSIPSNRIIDLPSSTSLETTLLLGTLPSIVKEVCHNIISDKKKTELSLLCSRLSDGCYFSK